MTYSKEQVFKALDTYEETKSVSKTVEILGYPCFKVMYLWIKKYPDHAPTGIKRSFKHASSEIKKNAVSRCLIRGESVESVSEDIGYSTSAIRAWMEKYRKKGIPLPMKKADTKDKKDTGSTESIEELKAQILDMQMDIDILKETINVIKKDPGVNLEHLKNREKAVVIDALRNKYTLPELFRKLSIPRSSYYYQESVLKAGDKYEELRKTIVELFNDNDSRYGYRRIKIALKDSGTIVSEKVIRRLMKQEGLKVKKIHKHTYNSYKGEITPAPPDLIKHDFHADKPNEKWLTDITEFKIRAGKVYLSPIIDGYDGMPIVWTIGTSPNAELANSMLKAGIQKLSPEEKPIIHSDRGNHYRWPKWIEITKEAGLKRSMSRKGCSPDNSACEGFFGHLKTEMFYGRNWDDYTIQEFIAELDSYMRWYCKDRIKLTLGGRSPLKYRKEMGVAV